MILCVNKVEEVVDIDDSNLEYLQTDIGIVKFAQQNGFINGFRVSAKEDINVSDAFSTLTREMILNQIRITNAAADKKKGGEQAQAAAQQQRRDNDQADTSSFTLSNSPSQSTRRPNRPVNKPG